MYRVFQSEWSKIETGFCIDVILLLRAHGGFIPFSWTMYYNAIKKNSYYFFLFFNLIRQSCKALFFTRKNSDITQHFFMFHVLIWKSRISRKDFNII